MPLKLLLLIALVVFIIRDIVFYRNKDERFTDSINNITKKKQYTIIKNDIYEYGIKSFYIKEVIMLIMNLYLLTIDLTPSIAIIAFLIWEITDIIYEKNVIVYGRIKEYLKKEEFIQWKNSYNCFNTYHDIHTNISCQRFRNNRKF